MTEGGLETMRADKLKVGDILHLKKDQRVPLDGLLLHTSDEFGSVFIRTDQLDGETDWKVKESVRHTQKMADRNPSDLLLNKWSVVIESPSDAIYSFSGNYYAFNSVFEPLRTENAIWANSKIATGDVYLLAIYTGLETRMALNSKKQIQKFGKTDEEINFLFKIVFGILVLISLAMFLISGSELHIAYWVEIIRVFAILSTLLPYMLKLNVDFAKLFYSYQINQDTLIEGTIVRNRQIPEELGRVEYLLSDKTGTLTRNEMIFKELSNQFGVFTVANHDELKSSIYDIYLKNGFMMTEKDHHIKNTLLALMLCNNVSPTWTDNERALQASSPDEVALVNYVETLGFMMDSRRTNVIKIKNPIGGIETYEICENFPFSSERMRMGILLRKLETNELLFFLKGADVIMETKVSNNDAIFVQEECERLSKDGLRTLVLSFRTVDGFEYSEWKSNFRKASQNLSLRAELERICIETLEKDMCFLGVTGVEDLLQEDIKNVVTNVRSAGIKVWMLTGDKLETARCIAISTGFKPQNQKFLEITTADSLEVNKKLDKFDPESMTLVVNGTSLQTILNFPKIKTLFFFKAMQAKAVIFCRCAPKQKAEITLILKDNYKKVVCSIGDGGNDVGMIQSASVGIGIEGKEGLQASLASDFSVRKFKHVLHLFLWHGRLSYLRTANLALLVIHRGFILTTIQYIFMAGLYFVTMNVYNGYLNMFYGTLFTNLVVFSMIFDEDIPKHQAFNYPQLYKLIQEGGELTFKIFLTWISKAIFQGAVIIILTLWLFPNSFLQIMTITFTALIFVEYLTAILVVRTWHRFIVLGLFLSLLSYLICLFFFKTTLSLSTLSLIDYLRILLLVSCGWFPILFAKLIQRFVYPSTVDKIINEAKTQDKRKEFKRNEIKNTLS